MSRLKAVLTLLLAVVTLVVSAQGTPIENVDTTDGHKVFTANCSACHQATGDGIPAVFPPLKGHVPDLLAVEGGRRYLVDVILFGVTGPITAANQRYDGLMPSWGHLSDAQLAAVLNYVAKAWDNRLSLAPGFVAFTAEEVLATRIDALDANAVRATRQLLGLD